MSQIEYDPKGMPFRRLGNTGLRVPLLCLGGWLTYGTTLNGDPVKDIIKTAFEAGINMFDTAEGYANGKSETEMGRAIKELGIRRSDLIITTKIYNGVGRKEPNSQGLSRKHLIEGLQESLDRLQLDYVDIAFAHQMDPGVPMFEIVHAFNFLIQQGKCLYWATSNWNATAIEEAFHVADKYNLLPPVADQCQYNALYRVRVEKDLKHVFERYNYGTMIYSPLASSFLTGKYNSGIIPAGSRLDASLRQDNGYIRGLAESLSSPIGKAKVEKIQKLEAIAKVLGCTTAQLAIAWAAKHPNVSTIILGATNPSQILENLKALEVLPKVTDEIYTKISEIFDY